MLGLYASRYRLASLLTTLSFVTLSVICQTQPAKPELVLQVGRTEGISCLAMSPDQRWLASGGYGSPVKIWDAITGHELRTLPAGTDLTFDVDISPDGKLLASAGQDGKVRVWEATSGRILFELEGTNPQTNSQLARMTPQQRAAVTPEMTRMMEKTSHGVWRVAFSPDGRWVASGSQDGTARVWDVKSGREAAAWRAEVETRTGTSAMAIKAVGFSADSQRALSLSQTPAMDTVVRVWNLAAAREERAFQIATSSVTSVAIRSESNRIVTVGGGGAVAVWDATTGKLIQSLGQRLDNALASALSRDGHWLAVAYGKIEGAFPVVASSDSNHYVKIWDVDSGKELTTLATHEGVVNALVFGVDGKHLITGSVTGDLKVWDTATAREVRTLAGQSRPVEAVAFSPDGRFLISGTTQNVSVWEIASGGNLPTPPLPDGSQVIGSGVFAAGGFVLPVIDHAHANVSLWEALAGKQVQSFSRAATQEIPQAALTADNHLLALVENEQKNNMLSSIMAMTQQSTNFMYDSTGARKSPKEMGKEMRRNGDASRQIAAQQQMSMQQMQEFAKTMREAQGDPSKLMGALMGTSRIQIQEVGEQGQPSVLQGLTGKATSIAFSPDGRFLAAGEQNGVVQIFGVNSGRDLQSFKTPMAMFDHPVLAFSPDGQLVAVAGFSDTIMLWQPSSNAEARTLPAHMMASSLAFSGDGVYLAAASMDGTIVIYEVATGKQVHTMTGAGSATSIAFSSDNRWLVSGDRDGATQFWDTESGALVATAISVGDHGDWLVVTPDGLFDGSPTAWDRILWRFARNTFDVAPVEIFFNEFFYPGLLGDLFAGKHPKPTVDISQKDRRQPTVKLLPTDDQPSDPRQVKLTLKVAEIAPDQDHPQGSGVRDVRLFRNGSLVKLWPGELKLDEKGNAELEVTVSVVAGNNRLTAYAFNRDNIKSADTSLIITGGMSLKKPGTAYILAVGINQYANPDYNLKYAVADAQDVSEELKAQQLKLGDLGEIEVIPLLDQDATKANILLALSRLAGKQSGPLPAGAPPVLEKVQAAQPEDEIFIYFAGHGAALGPRFYLIPHDLGYTGKRTELDLAGSQLIQLHSISDLELEDALQTVDARQILLVIDACNSGQALEAEEKRRGPMNSKGLAQLAYEKGMFVLTAAQGYQAALEAKELGHGLLTYALVEEGLKTDKADTSPKDGQVIAREWLDYATLRVPQLQQSQMDQAHKEGREISFVDEQQDARGDKKLRGLQRPRVFYRREPEAQPVVIARPGSPDQPETH